MGSLADEIAEAEREFAAATDGLTVAELRIDQLKAYQASGTSYEAYPTEADLSKEFDRRNAVERDALARLATVNGRLRDLRALKQAQLERQKAAEAARKLAAENEKKRQEELKKAPERAAGREYTPS